MPVMTRSRRSVAEIDRDATESSRSRRQPRSRAADKAQWSQPVDHLRSGPRLELMADGVTGKAGQELFPLPSDNDPTSLPLPLTLPSDGNNKLLKSDGLSKLSLMDIGTVPGSDGCMVVRQSGLDLQTEITPSFMARFHNTSYSPDIESSYKRLWYYLTLLFVGSALATIMGLSIHSFYYYFHRLKAEQADRYQYLTRCADPSFMLHMPPDLVAFTREKCQDYAGWVQSCCGLKALELIVTDVGGKVMNIAATVFFTITFVVLFAIWQFTSCGSRVMNRIWTEGSLLYTNYLVKKASISASAVVPHNTTA